MAPHSNILAYKIPWTEDPGGLQSMGSQSQTWLSMPIRTQHLMKGMAKIYSVLCWSIQMLSRCGGRKGRGAHGPSWSWRPVCHCLLQDRASTQMPDGGKLFSVMASGTPASPLTFVLAAAWLSLESLGSSWPSPNPTSPESGWWVRQEWACLSPSQPFLDPAGIKTTIQKTPFPINTENTFPNKYRKHLSQ